KVEDRHAPAVSDVEYAGDAGCEGGKEVGGDDIAHVDEVAGLAAVAEDGQRGGGEGLPDKNRNGRGVGTGGVLAGSEDVEVAKAGCLEPAVAVVVVAVILAVELGDGGRAAGAGGEVLVKRRGGIIPVDRRRAAEDEPANTGGG